MNFRNWLVSEETYDKSTYNILVRSGATGLFNEVPVDFTIYKNPSPEELDRCLWKGREVKKRSPSEPSQVAGILRNDDVYIAPRALMDHYDLQKKARIEYSDVAFYVDQSKKISISRWTTPSATQEDLEHPSIQEMLGARAEFPRLAS
jgi:hypothetical protein